jgi:L-seryl-tRNA(Ser) seleniumtransferase
VSDDPHAHASTLYRSLPSVNEMLATQTGQRLLQHFGRSHVVAAVRDSLRLRRAEIRQQFEVSGVPTSDQGANGSIEHLMGDVDRRLQQSLAQNSLQGVINATGIVLHTGLGRAPLAQAAIDAIVEMGGGYANVEIDLETGERGNRMQALTGLLCELTGAQAALVVNNNAAATMLVLAAMTAVYPKDGWDGAEDRRKKEIVVSRGELIEIGGQFRLPDIMTASGAVLREVGTTNKTRLSDYAGAINPRTAALMLVHPSNYNIVGFVEQVGIDQLVQLGRERSIPVIHDIGSGALIDLAAFGCTGEPLATHSLSVGADVVFFSGDKLLGGPQCGIILGRHSWLEAMARHPLARALRVDKLTLAALQATLRLYLNPTLAWEAIPFLKLLRTSLAELRDRAEAMVEELRESPAFEQVSVTEESSFIGGGSAPNQSLATICVAIRPRHGSIDQLAASLRSGQPAVLARIKHDQLLIDLRSVFPLEDSIITKRCELAGMSCARR